MLYGNMAISCLVIHVYYLSALPLAYNYKLGK